MELRGPGLDVVRFRFLAQVAISWQLGPAAGMEGASFPQLSHFA